MSSQAIVKIEKPERAFILAAGMGARLRPYTDKCPKPMVPVNGKPIIDYALDKLLVVNIDNVTVNLHYLGDVLEEHLSSRVRPAITLSREESLLDTGGGMKKALSTMGGKPFYALNGDALWTDGPQPALARLATVWDSRRMDLLLLLQPVGRMVLTRGVGDYDIMPDGRAVRSKDKTGTHMWTSLRICHPRLFENTPDEPFSFLELMDKAEAAGRLYALEHDADWHHINTPEELESVEEQFAAFRKRMA